MLVLDVGIAGRQAANHVALHRDGQIARFIRQRVLLHGRDDFLQRTDFFTKGAVFAVGQTFRGLIGSGV